MSRLVLALAVVAAASACAAALAAPRVATSYLFGRTGGNIEPFTVSIAADGAVHVRGPVRTVQQLVAAAGLARIATVLNAERFASLPATTRCPGALPDFAAFFVTVRTGTATKTVLVHGGCSTRFNAVLRALSAAVGLRYGTG